MVRKKSGTLKLNNISETRIRMDKCVIAKLYKHKLSSICQENRWGGTNFLEKQ